MGGGAEAHCPASARTAISGAGTQSKTVCSLRPADASADVRLRSIARHRLDPHSRIRQGEIEGQKPLPRIYTDERGFRVCSRSCDNEVLFQLWQFWHFWQSWQSWQFYRLTPASRLL